MSAAGAGGRARAPAGAGDRVVPGRQAMFAGKVSVFNRKMQLAHRTFGQGVEGLART
ncbi:hypothetical protein RB201_37835 [Streptomyces sp. S1A(2023)]